MNSVLRYLCRLAAVEKCRGLSDHELLGQFVRTRDEAAFAALVERHGPLVLAACRRLVPSLQDAEDVLQATFLVLVRKAATIRRRQAVSSWLYGVARRLALQVRQRAARQREGERQAGMASATRQTADQLTVEEGRQILEDELERLPEKYRTPILLCCLEDKSREEAARELGWAEGAVKIRLERGRQLLRDRLARRGLTLGGLLLPTLLARPASAALPVRLVANTVAAAFQFAAGKSLTGTVPAAVVTLAEGMLRALAWARVKVVATGMVMAVGIGVGALGISVFQQTPAPPAAALVSPNQVSNAVIHHALPTNSLPRVEGPTVTGTLRLVPGDARQVIIRSQEREAPYSLAPEVEVWIDGQPAQPADLKPSYRVQVTLSPDGQHAVRIRAAGPPVTGRVRSVDRQRNTLTVLCPDGDRGPTLRTLTLARNVTTYRQETPIALADLPEGGEVTLQVSVDSRTVLRITLSSE